MELNEKDIEKAISWISRSMRHYSDTEKAHQQTALTCLSEFKKMEAENEELNKESIDDSAEKLRLGFLLQAKDKEIAKLKKSVLFHLNNFEQVAFKLVKVEQALSKNEEDLMDTKLDLKSVEEAIRFIEDTRKSGVAFEDGAKKYSPNNWKLGINVHCFIDSAIRHYLKYLRGDTDEPHNRAVLWNLVGAFWTHDHIPSMVDLPFSETKPCKEDSCGPNI